MLYLKSLTALYNKILKVLSKMPEESAYRQYTHQTVSQRLAIVQKVLKFLFKSLLVLIFCFRLKETDVKAIEEKIGCGQVEELIVQAENEFSLAKRLLQCKPWEPLANKPPTDQWKWPL
jgi:NADH dehydrogenase (ubiquinone) 1 alpha subcomplex subunit 5